MRKGMQVRIKTRMRTRIRIETGTGTEIGIGIGIRSQKGILGQNRTLLAPKANSVT